MNEITTKIEKLRSEINRIKNEIRELEKENSNYYIGVCYQDNGYDVDYCYRRLGFISEATAKNWAEKQEEEYEDVFNAEYFEVTKEIYDKYYEWYCIYKLNKSIDMGNTTIKNLEGVTSFKAKVELALISIAEEIGISYRYAYPEECEHF